MPPIRVLLADDHRLFRQGIRQICEILGKFEVVGEAENGQEAVDAARELQPDIILMDINMPLLDGVQATSIITRNNPCTRVIVLTMYRQDQYVFEAIKAGARGYLLKDSDEQELLDTVHAVHRGEALIDPNSGYQGSRRVSSTEPDDRRGWCRREPNCGRNGSPAPCSTGRRQQGHRRTAFAFREYHRQPIEHHLPEAPRKQPHPGGSRRPPPRVGSPGRGRRRNFPNRRVDFSLPSGEFSIWRTGARHAIMRMTQRAPFLFLPAARPSKSREEFPALFERM